LSRDYPARPLVGIGVAVLRPDAVLLIRRGNPPNQGSWALPGGGQELGETAEACARRELAEETGLQVGALHLVAIVDSITPDATGRIRFHYTIIDFAALWLGDEHRAGGDAMACAWAPFDRLLEYDLWSEALRVIAIGRDLLRLVPGRSPG
jgi:ADP-ribose pyrophosphatase YjhB (NUDIX family)